MSAAPPQSPELAAAYAHCRNIARKHARNFYYAFIALPRQKRDAICAVYAFMRRADDIADDPTRSIDQRRDELASWLRDWQQVATSTRAAAGNPIFFALHDAQQRFAIPGELLEELVAGTQLDIAPAPQLTYATFEDLYRYCYLVASVVGLVSIRIFGYTDPRAEQLAEQTGIAFQITNILRDVAEDARMGRIYLPVEDMVRFNVSAAEILRPTASTPSPNLRALLEFEAARAHEYYRAADELIPLISPDARPAMGVLVTIYRRLLTEMEHRGFPVFSERISVPAHAKYTALARGLLQTMLR
jgi:15-cis-phytoene synthase